ncbi:probable E3 ubiquitin-protein ligase DTX3 [Pocillopora damicornis]|nr:probable E3 ubiquitin-protein ligase DTX3 [Pocillopora damicornis]
MANTSTENAKKLKCGHVFCTDCVETALTYDNRCPVCKEPQGVVKGNQPDGQMHVFHGQQSLPGYRGCRTIIITYVFPSGIQGREHPHPGETYSGTSRTAYLPDNREGKEVLALLRRAFDARLVFTVGTSVTSGWLNQITWNDIHHKTSISGGPQAYGYPDPDYLRRVKEDLAAKGIR